MFWVDSQRKSVKSLYYVYDNIISNNSHKLQESEYDTIFGKTVDHFDWFAFSAMIFDASSLQRIKTFAGEIIFLMGLISWHRFRSIVITRMRWNWQSDSGKEIKKCLTSMNVQIFIMCKPIYSHENKFAYKIDSNRNRCLHGKCESDCALITVKIKWVKMFAKKNETNQYGWRACHLLQ